MCWSPQLGLNMACSNHVYVLNKLENIEVVASIEDMGGFPAVLHPLATQRRHSIYITLLYSLWIVQSPAATLTLSYCSDR